MKVALYIEEGREQIVLTPENDTEKMVLAKLEDSSRSVEILHGSFFTCQGGWTRYSPSFVEPYGRERQNDHSTMILLTAKRADDPQSSGAEG